MNGLIQKSGYIRPGNGGGHYAEYIATRDGVEMIEPAASGYLEYMAERPRSHGLFAADGAADLEQTMEEINAHAGPVWTFVYSLKREDAARLGYENGDSWRRLLLAHQIELATAMKIPPSSFRWCAAFHDEKHHPHIHMMAWSDNPKHGYLTERGIEQIRSQLSNDIFQDELMSLYQEKDLSYQEVRDTAMEAMGQLVREMKSGLCDSPVIAEQMETLAGTLSEVKGKKVYGYLKKPVKAQVDAIVDELGKLPQVAECYDHWNRLRDELERYYKDTPREHKSLSQQPEFKAIKNLVIREADNLQLGVFTFEDAQMKDEVDEDQDAVFHAWSSRWEMAETYQNAKEILSVYENTEEEKAEQVQVLEQLWDAGFTIAAHQLGKCWRDGRGVLPDDKKAELWFQCGAEAGHDFSQYALGKLLQRQKRIDEAVSWYEKAAVQGNSYAAYQLGKLYLQGEQVQKDVAKALEYLTQGAEQGNQYAQYTLGKLYLMGEEVAQDREQAYSWLSESAFQGNEYAQFLLDHFNDSLRPTVLLAVTNLLHHMGRIFQDNSVPPAVPTGQQVDRKLRRKIQEKKIAMGHKPDDHENTGPQMSM
ncbi:sel1 repeat family protein [Pseudoflavonifractor sp. AF19-9AC]|uniref:MobP3 family relaxase n=1 Tax=Pseudoflavonifractor sp. AF19-9AC TaxID=2292244 RepID=UPI000E4B4655|nr:MobP3 family relaxase [Pseudoflavonifractor sp. AF19-9AC]RHR08191.1 sel1 repeat family protein [Pseudoflavonifractor sp. AF19-9AC]